MGCMPFPYGQRHNRGLYRGKSDPWGSDSGATECTLWEHSRCSTDSECRMYSGCQAYLQQLQAQYQNFVQAFMQAAA